MRWRMAVACTSDRTTTQRQHVKYIYLFRVRFFSECLCCIRNDGIVSPPCLVSHCLTIFIRWENSQTNDFVCSLAGGGHRMIKRNAEKIDTQCSAHTTLHVRLSAPKVGEGWGWVWVAQFKHLAFWQFAEMWQDACETLFFGVDVNVAITIDSLPRSFCVLMISILCVASLAHSHNQNVENIARIDNSTRTTAHSRLQSSSFSRFHCVRRLVPRISATHAAKMSRPRQLDGNFVQQQPMEAEEKNTGKNCQKVFGVTYVDGNNNDDRLDVLCVAVDAQNESSVDVIAYGGLAAMDEWMHRVALTCSFWFWISSQITIFLV